MGWLGAGIGALFGSRGGILAGLISAVVGSWAEDKLRQMTADTPTKGSANPNELTLLAALSAMLSKLAKADGRITADEVRYCEGVFDRLGLAGEKRAFCIRVFREAKSDAHTLLDYAASFAAQQPAAEVRVLVYGILWDLACADGIVAPAEDELLRAVVTPLRVDARLYLRQRAAHGLRDPRSAAEPEDPYAVLGCSRRASDDEVRRVYREKAKRLHPDALRAQGVSEELLARANEQMARLNAAWAEVKRKRGL